MVRFMVPLRVHLLGFLLSTNARAGDAAGTVASRGKLWRAGLACGPALLAGFGCGDAPEHQASSRDATSGKPVVFAVNYPLDYFAQRLAGDRIERLDLIPLDVDPAFWRPGPEAIGKIQSADLILLNGADYAKWVPTTTLPESRMLNTSATLADRLIHVADLVTHSHGPEGEHSHGGVAFTTWLDASMALEQARAVHDALRPLLPGAQTELAAGWASLAADLEALDRRWQGWGAAVGSRPLWGSHPVYQYLARRCDLNLVSLDWEPDAMPDEDSWQDLAKRRIDHPATWMLWEAEPLPAVRERLKAMGIGCVVVMPCGNRPGQGNYLEVMKGNLERLKAVTVSGP